VARARKGCRPSSPTPRHRVSFCWRGSQSTSLWCTHLPM
jgi:hypothetical protein